jgi:neutral trehalase
LKITNFAYKEEYIYFLLGGIPASLENRTKEQWDYPNGWAPSNHLFIESLRRCSHPKANEIARNVTVAFVSTVFNGLFNPPTGMVKRYMGQSYIEKDIGECCLGKIRCSLQ